MLLKTLLLIPLGAVVLTFFRNIIGFKTFGIFMPCSLRSSSWKRRSVRPELFRRAGAPRRG
jgi:hypothetical protein